MSGMGGGGMGGNPYTQVIGGIIQGIGVGFSAAGGIQEYKAAKERNAITNIQNAVARRQSAREGFVSINTIANNAAAVGLERSTFGRGGTTSAFAQTAFNMAYAQKVDSKVRSAQDKEQRAKKFNTIGSFLQGVGSIISG